MRRFATLCATALLASALCAVPPAHAADGPTLQGPAVAGYYEVFTLSGTTSEPGQGVDVYARHASPGARFARVRHLVSNGSATFTVSFHQTETAIFYVRAGGAQSASVTVRLRAATCTVSGPAFKRLPLHSPLVSRTWPDFAAFTANRGRTWAGIAASVDQGAFAIIRWRPGHPVRIIHSVAYHHGSYEPADPASVRVVAITPHGYLAVTVQSPRFNLEDDRFGSWVWRSGHLHRVTTRPAWRSLHLAGIDRAGHLYGWVRTGSVGNSRYAIVRWTESGTSPHYLTRYQHNAPQPVVDATGDIAYLRDDGLFYVRLVTGRTVVLPELPITAGGTEATVAAPTGSTFYGQSNSQLASWSVSSAGVAPPVARSTQRFGNSSHYTDSVGPHGEIVDGYFATRRHPQHLITSDRAYATVPAQLNADETASGRPGETFDATGALAFTSAKDGLPHFLRCR